MWEISLAMVAAIVSQQPQAATLEGCEFVEQRWICRYRLPEVQLLTSPPTTQTSAPATPPIAPTSVPVTVPVTTPPLASQDPGVLSESQISLVARCADAGWMSLCLPSQRIEARRLRDESHAYEAARLRVGELLSENHCDEARAFALSGGYLGLARESQTLCAIEEADDQSP